MQLDLRLTLISLSLLYPLALHHLDADEPTITTIAGTGFDKLNPIGAPRETNIGYPFGVEWGRAGELYICEVTHHRLWRLDPAKNRLSVIAGTGQVGYAGDGGRADAAQMNEPYEVRLDDEGHLYVVEMQNHCVRRIDANTGVISTIAGTGQAGFGGDGGPAAEAQLKQPHSIALDGQGFLYIADIGNHRIRRVDLESGIIETIAGNGQRELPRAGQTARDRPVLGPRALYVTDRTLWVALREGHSVWTLDLDAGTWQHVAGSGQSGYTGDGGPAARATMNGPKGIAVDDQGNVFVVDTENQVIRRIDAQTQRMETIAGSGPEHVGYGGDDGPPRRAQLNRPHGICVARRDGQMIIVVGDTENHRVRQICLPVEE